MEKHFTKENLVEMVDHVLNHGKDYEYYTLYFKDETTMVVEEKEFYAMDKLFDGELAAKVLN